MWKVCGEIKKTGLFDRHWWEYSASADYGKDMAC